jgi:hypothetical protein
MFRFLSFTVNWFPPANVRDNALWRIRSKNIDCRVGLRNWEWRQQRRPFVPQIREVRYSSECNQRKQEQDRFNWYNSCHRPVFIDFLSLCYGEILENIIGFELIKKFLFYGARRLIAFFTWARYLRLFWATQGFYSVFKKTCHRGHVNNARRYTVQFASGNSVWICSRSWPVTVIVMCKIVDFISAESKIGYVNAWHYRCYIFRSWKKISNLITSVSCI